MSSTQTTDTDSRIDWPDTKAGRASRARKVADDEDDENDEH